MNKDSLVKGGMTILYMTTFAMVFVLPGLGYEPSLATWPATEHSEKNNNENTFWKEKVVGKECVLLP